MNGMTAWETSSATFLQCGLFFPPRETAPLEEKYCIQWNLYILNIKYLKHMYEYKSRFVNINKAYSLNSIS